MATTPQLRADARRNRERIVAAAAELFAAEGIDCQVAEVARRAGLGNATVFRHFPTKRDLVLAIAEARMDELLALADEAAEQEDPTVGLQMLVERMGATIVADHGLKQMIAAQFGGDETMRCRRDSILARLETVVDRCRRAGTVRPDVQAIDVVVLVHGVATAVLGLEDERPGLHRRYLALALAGLSPEAGSSAPLAVGPPSADELDEAWRRQARPASGG